MKSGIFSISFRRISFRRGPVVRLCVTGLLALWIGVAPESSRGNDAPASGPQGGLSIEKVEVGLRGYYKVGEWAPLWVTLRSSDEREVALVIDTPDPDDNVTSLPGRPFVVKPGALQRCQACFRTGRMNGELHVHVEDGRGHRLASRRLRVGNSPDAEFRPALRLDDSLWLTLGNIELAPSGIDNGREPRVVRFPSPNDLPADCQLLESVDLMIFTTSRPAGESTSRLGQLSSATAKTLEDWVEGGGHLLISIASETEAFQKSPLAKWIRPIVVEGQSPVRQLSSLEGFSGQNVPLKFSGTVTTAKFEKLPSPNVILRHSGNPQVLAASVPHGFGHVTVIGVDIDAPPVANWKSLMLVLQKLAGSRKQLAGEQTPTVNRQLTHVGVTDLATQFQQTHENFPAVHRPSYWWVMGLILLYVAVIGPLDYLFVGRVLRRPELTWATFPALVCAAVAVAAWEANRLNARGLLMNQFDLVDIDGASGAVRAQTWVSLYSPEHRRFRVAVEPDDPGARGTHPRSTKPAEVQMRWMAPPENAVGGIYRPGAAFAGGRGYSFSPLAAAVDNLPVAQWSTKSLSAAWRDELPQSVVDCRLESFGAGQLKGTITHHLGAPLEDCLLVVNGWAFIPRTTDATLESGYTWKPSGETVSQRDLKALLTGEKQARRDKEDAFSAEKTRITTTIEPYNSLSRNRAQQVAMLTFHEAAGGTEYTGLANAALRDLELTELMQLGRGVLIGRLPSSTAKVVVDGSPSLPAGRSTWVRFVLPVVQTDRAVEKNIPKLNEPPPANR